MSEDVLVKVDGLSKKFCKDLKTSLRYGVSDMVAEVLGKEKNNKLRPKEFWAVNDVSFELKRGQCLGLIGRNGAGKSTLLKMLNGLIKPDKGRIEMRGRVAALIELGAGFNPILTGRENIYNNAAILGFKKKEIDHLLGDIIAFSEMEEFIDTPVQYYSSGMKVRLGFAVAVHIKPDILILDEVMAVGDAGFKMKSLNKMYELISTCAVIFVNHSNAVISRVSTDILYMKDGQQVYSGNNVSHGIELYQAQFKGETSYIEINNKAQFHDIKLSSSESTKGALDQMLYVRYGNALHIDFEFSVDHAIESFYIGVGFTNKDLIGVAGCASDLIINNKKERQRVRLSIPEILFTNGEYSLTFYIFQEERADVKGKRKFFATYRNWMKFYVTSEYTYDYAHFILKGTTKELNNAE